MRVCQTHLPPSVDLSPILDHAFPVPHLQQYPMPSRKRREWEKKVNFKSPNIFHKDYASINLYTGPSDYSSSILSILVSPLCG